MRRYREKMAINKPRAEASEEINYADMVNLDFWLLEL